MPALCCLFPGSSARRPPRDPPLHHHPGIVPALSPSANSPLQAAVVFSSAWHAASSTPAERPERRGSAGPRVVCPPPRAGKAG